MKIRESDGSTTEGAFLEVLTDDVLTELKYDTSPVGTEGGRQNWVDKQGGLPPFIRAVAHALIRSGRPKDQAISIAIGRIRDWAEGKGNVSAKTRAKAIKTIAAWEKMKAKQRATKTLERACFIAGIETKDVVRTPEGADYFDQPIGSQIIRRSRRQRARDKNRTVTAVGPTVDDAFTAEERKRKDRAKEAAAKRRDARDEGIRLSMQGATLPDLEAAYHQAHMDEDEYTKRQISEQIRKLRRDTREAEQSGAEDRNARRIAAGAKPIESRAGVQGEADAPVQPTRTVEQFVKEYSKLSSRQMVEKLRQVQSEMAKLLKERKLTPDMKVRLATYRAQEAALKTAYKARQQAMGRKCDDLEGLIFDAFYYGVPWESKDIGEGRRILHVATDAGVRRYNKPKGSIIAGNGRLGNIQSRGKVGPSMPKWWKVEGNNGKEFEIGPEGGKWLVTTPPDPEGNRRALFEGDDEYDAYMFANREGQGDRRKVDRERAAAAEAVEEVTPAQPEPEVVKAPRKARVAKTPADSDVAVAQDDNRPKTPRTGAVGGPKKEKTPPFMPSFPMLPGKKTKQPNGTTIVTSGIKGDPRVFSIKTVNGREVITGIQGRAFRPPTNMEELEKFEAMSGKKLAPKYRNDLSRVHINPNYGQDFGGKEDHVAFRYLADSEMVKNPDGTPKRDAEGNIEYAGTQWQQLAGTDNRATQARSDSKWDRMYDVLPRIGGFQAAIDKEVDTGSPAALLLALVVQTGMRQGSDDAATRDNDASFGATTMQAQHMTIDGNAIHIEFIGKKGTPNVYDVTDPKLAKLLKARLKGKAPDEQIFPDVKPSDTLAVLKKTIGVEDARVHDLRSAIATNVTISEVEKYIRSGEPLPTTEKEFIKLQKKLAEAARIQVNDKGVGVVINSYIGPRTWVPILREVVK